MESSNDENRACMGKVSHKYKTSCDYVLSKMEGSTLVSYKCGFCNNYHIGNIDGVNGFIVKKKRKNKGNDRNKKRKNKKFKL